MIGIDNSPLLKINRLLVSGELGCDIRLSSGINIVKAESFGDDDRETNDCGKTTFTNLIKYGLGDRDRFSSGEIAQKIQYLFLEVNLNNKIFTIRRDLNKPGSRVGIFENSYQSTFEYDNPSILVDPKTPFSDFILGELEIPNLKISRSTRPGSQPLSVTFQEFLRLLYMDQKNSFQEFMYKVQPEWMKGKTVQILLGMSKEEVEELKNRIQSLANEIDDLQRKINHITDFLVSSGYSNRIEILEKISEFESKRRDTSRKINEIKIQMRGKEGLTDELRDNLDHANRTLTDLREKRSKLLFKMQDFQNLLNSFLVDRDKIRKIKESNFVLSSIDFAKCPRCLQSITSEMRQREINGSCQLCERPLLVESDKVNILDKDDAVEEEIKEVKILLSKYENDLLALNSEIQINQSEKYKLEDAIDQRTETYVSPFVDDLERLLLVSNRIDAEIETLNHQIAQWDLLEKREELLSQLKTQKKKLQMQLSGLDVGDNTKIRKLSEYYESFLRRVEDVKHIRARINPEDMMPLVNGNLYTEDVGSGMQAVRIIGYHYSLLDFSMENPCYYPKFLILDSPRAFDLNRDTYERLLLQFHRLQKRVEEIDFQVILTTRDLPEIMEKYVYERLNSSSRMLLRVEGEREQSSPPF